MDTGETPRRVNIKGLVALTHPVAVVAWSIVTVFFSCVAVQGVPDLALLARLVIVVATSQVCIGATNEYCDREVDRVLKPWRPLPSGQVTPRTAVGLAVGAGAVTLVGAAGLGPLGLLGAVVGTGTGLAHNFWLKRTAFSWLPFALGYSLHPAGIWIIYGRFSPALLALLLYGLPLILGIHLADQLPDTAERRLGIAGLVHRLGPERGRQVTVGVLLTSPLIMLIPLRPDLLGYPHALFVGGLLFYYAALAVTIRCYRPVTTYHRLKQGFLALEFGLLALLPLYLAAGTWQ